MSFFFSLFSRERDVNDKRDAFYQLDIKGTVEILSVLNGRFNHSAAKVLQLILSYFTTPERNTFASTVLWIRPDLMTYSYLMYQISDSTAPNHFHGRCEVPIGHHFHPKAGKYTDLVPLVLSYATESVPASFMSLHPVLGIMMYQYSSFDISANTECYMLLPLIMLCARISTPATISHTQAQPLKLRHIKPSTILEHAMFIFLLMN